MCRLAGAYELIGSDNKTVRKAAKQAQPLRLDIAGRVHQPIWDWTSVQADDAGRYAQGHKQIVIGGQKAAQEIGRHLARIVPTNMLPDDARGPVMP